MRRKCEYCGQVFPVLRRQSWYTDEVSEDVVHVRWIVNPYGEEINDDHTCHWICDTCYTEELDAI